MGEVVWVSDGLWIKPFHLLEPASITVPAGVTLVGVADNDAPLINVGNGGEFVMKSGAITGNIRVGDGWVFGGGVEVNGGTFTMEGGTDETLIAGKERTRNSASFAPP
jgi:hypothetical protein